MGLSQVGLPVAHCRGKAVWREGGMFVLEQGEGALGAEVPGEFVRYVKGRAVCLTRVKWRKADQRQHEGAFSALWSCAVEENHEYARKGACVQTPQTQKDS